MVGAPGYLGCCNSFEGRDARKSSNCGDGGAVIHDKNFEVWLQTGAAKVQW